MNMTMQSMNVLRVAFGVLALAALAPIGCATDRQTSSASQANAAATTPTATTNAPPRLPPVEPDAVRHEFDFWIGEWVVLNGDGKQVGTSRIERVENGFAIEEFWTSALGATGRSLNYVDPKDGKWKQVWVSSRGNVTYYTGEYREGSMQFTGESISLDGTVEIVRARFTAMRNGTVRQFIEHSRDQGETWYVYFDGYYHPKK